MESGNLTDLGGLNEIRKYQMDTINQFFIINLALNSITILLVIVIISLVIILKTKINFVNTLLDIMEVRRHSH